jgi:DNA repair protein RadA/Sms
LIVLGEIGLAGECRSVSNTNQRINESIRLGFTRIAVPHRSVKSIKVPKEIEIIPLRSVYDLLKLIDN